ncbi:3-oxoacid CoA-transferase subunit B [Halalkalibacter nanhaiisediminis]|uniref:6-acetamido-3-oxohexanoate:acetyl-CoA CoA transferase beta subunit n=1 Tax=Halalkalibacter nanhaiisediminis TaxID=688079 RepID=A0A562QQV0_9BACI|nr:3-oxoacid CoA-transferase subunit B [Halalkalibacter nanhaiisediminis]TWI59053.1 6-acetamido-3-oxohexanoate:acetyl-CoA CoA transferase beta subunit [Halalkalibacter nanhaiisediminis]
MGLGIDVRNRMARRAAKEIKDGMIVNLGIGIPSLVSNHLSRDHNVMFHSENGVLGMGASPEKGKENPMLCNAAGYPVTIVPGASYFDSTTAFSIIRAGLLDITILGGLEVSEKGDLANWIIPGKRVPGIGGAMELARKAKRVIVLLSHLNKNGEPKIVPTCTLPLTAERCVNMIITDMAIIEVTEGGLILTEVMAPFTVEEVIEKTGAKLLISENVETVY